MYLLKKVSGIILLIVSIFFSLILLIVSFKAVFDCIRVLNQDTSTGIGYVLGSLLVLGLIFILIRFMFKWSLKLIKTKEVPQDSIDEIGL